MFVVALKSLSLALTEYLYLAIVILSEDTKDIQHMIMIDLCLIRFVRLVF